MQALIAMIAGFIALLAAASLSMFGVELHLPRADREVSRVVECGDAPTPVAAASERKC